MATRFRTCPLCEAMCGLRIETEGDRVTSIRGDADDPLSRGYLCPKGPALKAIHEDPDRLRHPVRRVGDRWERIGWDEALDLAVDGIHRAQAKHGRDAVAIYLGNPTVHNVGAALFAPMLVRALRTRNRFSATSVDQLPHHLAAHWMFGHQFLLPIPDVDRTRHMLILGANPLASNGSLMSAPDMRGRLRAIQERGGSVVVVDPRRTETARAADEHVFIRPGTDGWLLAAILNVAFERGRGLGRLAEHTENADVARRAVEGFTPERAAGPTGIGAATIERLASRLCEAESGICYGRVGVSTHPFGGLCQWLINAINLVTGNFDRPGGVMFTKPAVDAVDAPLGLGVGRGSFGRWKSRVRGLPETGGELPVATLADEILTEGEGQVRAVVTSAGNPVLSTPNGGRLDEALASLDHMVCIDPYVNETTRHAHVILPPPSPLERWHYDVAFHVLAVRNTAKLSAPLFDPPSGAMPEHEILLELIARLEDRRGRHGWRARLRHEALRRLGPEGLVDLGLRVGPYGLRAKPPKPGLTAKALLEQPHGVDLGPLEPCMPERMRKWRRRIDLAPSALVADLERLADEGLAEDAADDALRLIGRRHLRSNNSWMHNAPKLVAGKPICSLLMHPDDAGERSIEDGQTVEVSSRVGRVRVPVELTDDVMPGVVSLPHGFGHDRPGVRLSVAREHAGVSLNDLTDERRLDGLSANAALTGVPVRIAPVRE